MAGVGVGQGVAPVEVALGRRVAVDEGSAIWVGVGIRVSVRAGGMLGVGLGSGVGAGLRAAFVHPASSAAATRTDAKTLCIGVYLPTVRGG